MVFFCTHNSHFTFHIFGFLDFCIWAAVCVSTFCITIFSCCCWWLRFGKKKYPFDIFEWKAWRKCITTMLTKLNKRKCKWKYHLRISEFRDSRAKKKWIETNQSTEMFAFCSAKTWRIFWGVEFQNNDKHNSFVHYSSQLRPIWTKKSLTYVDIRNILLKTIYTFWLWLFILFDTFSPFYRHANHTHNTAYFSRLSINLPSSIWCKYSKCDRKYIKKDLFILFHDSFFLSSFYRALNSITITSTYLPFHIGCSIAYVTLSIHMMSMSRWLPVCSTLLALASKTVWPTKVFQFSSAQTFSLQLVRFFYIIFFIQKLLALFILLFYYFSFFISFSLFLLLLRKIID